MTRLLVTAALAGVLILPAPVRASGKTAVLQAVAGPTLTLNGSMSSAAASGTGALRDPSTGRTYPVAWEEVIVSCCHFVLITRTYGYLNGKYRELSSIGTLSDNCVPDCADSNGMVYARLWRDPLNIGPTPAAHTTFYFVKR